MPRFVGIFLFLCILPYVSCFLEGIYCGKENCYEVLDVNRDSSRSEINKAYRQLARKHHPDVHKTKEAKKTAEVKFMSIANAYEILKDEESRKDYDYMLDNPDLFYQHYYRYYRHRMAPKVDVRIVIAVSLTVLSVFQYWNSWSRYHSAMSYLATVPKYRIQVSGMIVYYLIYLLWVTMWINFIFSWKSVKYPGVFQALAIAKQEGLLNKNKKRSRKTKEELKEEEETTIKKVLADKMDIKGGYSKPLITDVLWVQLVLLPYTLGKYFHWYIKWIYRFNICKEEYGEVEKDYLIKKYMGCSSSQWAAIEDDEKEDYFYHELWIKDNFLEWKKNKDEEMQAKLAESAKYKSYRRYLRNHGPGAITFED
ncbi:DnaJ subfamily C member 25 [Nymphon striatum]|nr:DnaJ subfamily C member 25 [Nymphon striatum]